MRESDDKKARLGKDLSVLLYDSGCPQCAWFVRQLKRLPPELKVVALLGKEAGDLFEQGRLQIDPSRAETMIVLSDGKELLEWEALLFCMRYSGIPNWCKRILNKIPSQVGNVMYRRIAWFRRKFRKKSACTTKLR